MRKGFVNGRYTDVPRVGRDYQHIAAGISNFGDAAKKMLIDLGK